MMVHLTTADLELPSSLRSAQVDELKLPPAFSALTSAKAHWKHIDGEIRDDVDQLNEAELVEIPSESLGPRWMVVLQVGNHGTDHRATLQKGLSEMGAPTFDQDLISWFPNTRDTEMTSDEHLSVKFQETVVYINRLEGQE